MSDSIRAALERLIELNDHPDTECAAWDDAIEAACVALAAAPEGEGPSAEQVEELCEEHCFNVEGYESIECLQGLINDALARWGHQPTPPAEGEVGELMAWLQSMRELAGEHNPEEQRRYDRTAELLQQQETELQEYRKALKISTSTGKPMTDYRALCAELFKACETLYKRSVTASHHQTITLSNGEHPIPISSDMLAQDAVFGDLLHRARAVLAEEQGEGPSNEELTQLLFDNFRGPIEFICDAEEVAHVMIRNHIKFARAVLARWGHQPAPVPVSERLPGPGEMDGSLVWCGSQAAGLPYWEWCLDDIRHPGSSGYTHWLPANTPALPTALPLPQGVE